MKVKNLGLQITEVPGVGIITAGEFGIRVGGSAIAITREQAQELREALTVAIDHTPIAPSIPATGDDDGDEPTAGTWKVGNVIKAGMWVELRDFPIPVGTVLTDSEQVEWKVYEDGWYCEELSTEAFLVNSKALQRRAPFEIVSIPS